MNKRTYELDDNEIWLNMKTIKPERREEILNMLLHLFGEYINTYAPVCVTGSDEVLGYIFTWKTDFESIVIMRTFSDSIVQLLKKKSQLKK